MSDLIEANSEQIQDNYCLIFSLDSKTYGINIKNIVEVIKIQKLDIPQQMPKHILGVIAYNNLSIKVVDTASVLLHKPQKYSIDAQIIIVKTEEAIFGLMIDNSADVHRIKSSNIQSLPYHSEDNLIQFLYRENDLMASIIDVCAIQNVIQKNQFEAGEVDTTILLPEDAKNLPILQKRQLDLIKKFETGIEQIYYDRIQLVIFAVGGNFYSMPIQKIKEIVSAKNISLVSLPEKYDYIEGIINLRGEFISVFNFSKLLNLNSEYEISTEKMLIVIDDKEFKMALIVDDIIDISTITQNEITQKHDNKLNFKYITGEFLKDGKVISTVDIEKLLSDDRIYIND